MAGEDSFGTSFESCALVDVDVVNSLPTVAPNPPASLMVNNKDDVNKAIDKAIGDLEAKLDNKFQKMFDGFKSTFTSMFEKLQNNNSDKGAK